MKRAKIVLWSSMVAGLLWGCGGSPARSPVSAVARPAAIPKAVVISVARSNEPLPLALSQTRLTASIVERLRRRVMGRRVSLADTERIVREVAPIVGEAVRQPEAQEPLRQMARDMGVSSGEARQRWIAWQEADLLLESGGDPDAISSSRACGVAQWMAGTAQGVGLKVDVAGSAILTRQITETSRQIAWREYLLRPDADRNAPGALQLSPEEANAQLPALRAECDRLRMARRALDARFDPRKAIFAQTRYLLRLYKRFPSPDWLFQAYHGGEGGVTRTLKTYLRSAWPGTPAQAIRRGNGGKRLRFEDLYFHTTPRNRPEAFAYLYGRSDDHRHYWWKLRAAQESLAVYKHAPADYRKRWEALFPGRGTQAFWYPNAQAESLSDLPTLQMTVASGSLVPVKASPMFRFCPAPFDLPNAPAYEVLRPETRGVLALVAEAYRRAGGKEPLVIGDMTLTQEYIARRRVLSPPPPPKPPLWPPDPDSRAQIGGGPPADFDFHTAGVTFDILKPSSVQDRKRLDYALGYLEDRQILSRGEELDFKTPRYHIVANPRYDVALTQLGESGAIPNLPGL